MKRKKRKILANRTEHREGEDGGGKEGAHIKSFRTQKLKLEQIER